MLSYKITFHIRESSGCSLFSAIVTCQMITQRLHSRQHIRPLVTYVTNAASFRNGSFLGRAKLCFLKSEPSKTKLSASKSSVHHMLRSPPGLEAQKGNSKIYLFIFNYNCLAGDLFFNNLCQKWTTVHCSITVKPVLSFPR